MRFATPFLMSTAVLVVALAASCSSSPAADSSSSSGEPAGDDDDNGTSGKGTSGKTTSGSGGTSGKPAGLTVQTEESFEFQGQTQKYLLVKPTNYDAAKKYPLVLNLHGNPAKPQNEVDAMPFDTVTKQDAIIGYPGATDGSDWNFAAPSQGNPDMELMPAIVDEIASKVSIDKTRVLGFGYSGGAYFLSQYGCRVGGAPFKMIAFFAGGAPQGYSDLGEDEDSCLPCKGNRVPMFIAHGLNDNSPDVSFQAGDFARQCWAATNGCNENDLTDATAPCKTYNGCNQPVTWCPVPNQDHGPWQGAMQQAWDMFKALP